MNGNVYDPGCPTRTVLDRIGDRWTVLIVLVLLPGPLRFNELRDGIGRIAPKVLTETLRRLERDGIVTRTAYAEMPPRVVYELTPLGRSLEDPLQMIAAWSEQNIAQVVGSRQAYDERGAVPS